MVIIAKLSRTSLVAPANLDTGISSSPNHIPRHLHSVGRVNPHGSVVAMVDRAAANVVTGRLGGVVPECYAIAGISGGEIAPLTAVSNLCRVHPQVSPVSVAPGGILPHQDAATVVMHLKRFVRVFTV